MLKGERHKIKSCDNMRKVNVDQLQCGMKIGGGAEGLAGLALLPSTVPAQSSAHSAAGSQKYSGLYLRNTVNRIR